MFVLIILLMGALACSIAVSGREPDAYLIVRYGGSLFLLAAISLVSCAVGMGFVRPKRANVFALSLSFLAGYGFLGMLLFFTGLAHGLYAPLIAVELLVLGILFRHQVQKILSGIGRMITTLRDAPTAMQLLMWTILVYLAFLLLISLGSVTSWDALESHWPIAKYFARHHGVPFPFFNGNGGTPQLMRMHFSVFCLFGFAPQASHAVWVMVPALFGVGFGMTRRLSSSAVALALTLGALCILVVQPQLTLQPTLDVPPVVFGVGALVASLMPALHRRFAQSEICDRPTETGNYFVLSGLLAGYALGTKWHIAVLFPIVMICYFLFWREEFPILSRRNKLSLWIGGAFLPFFVFAFYDLAYTGNPFWHPMVPTYWDSGFWSPVAMNLQLVRENVEIYRSRLCPTPLHDLMGSLRWILLNHALILPALFFVPFSLGDIRGPHGKIIFVLLGGGMLCFLVPALILYPHYRHTMLGVAILVLLIPFGWNSLSRSKYRWLATVFPVLVIIGVATKFIAGRHPQVFDLYGPALVSVVRGPYYDETYLTRYGIPATRWANAHLPEDVFIVADQRCLGNLDRDWMTIFPATQFVVELTADLPVDSLYNSLVHLGATHLWVDRARHWDAPRDFPSLAACMTPWELLLTRKDLLESVYADTLTLIYRLHPPGNR